MDGPLNKVKALNKKWKVRTPLHGGIMVIMSQAIDIFEVLTTNMLEYMVHNVIGSFYYFTFIFYDSDIKLFFSFILGKLVLLTILQHILIYYIFFLYLKSTTNSFFRILNNHLEFSTHTHKFKWFVSKFSFKRLYLWFYYIQIQIIIKFDTAKSIYVY